MNALPSSRHERRILAVALVRATPAHVLGHRDDRPEVPADAGRVHLGRRRLADPRRPAPGRAPPPGRRCAGRSSRRRRCCGRGRRRRRRASGSRAGSRARRPGTHRPSRTSRRRRSERGTAAAAEHGAEEQVGDVVRLDRVLLELGHLADLLVERHLGEQRHGARRGGLRRIVPVDRGGTRRDAGRRYRSVAMTTLGATLRAGAAAQEPAPRPGDDAERRLVAHQRSTGVAVALVEPREVTSGG